ncbi:MAG: sigma 54-interacting transcriptional regulator [Acidobacteriota bacterium]|nr:sigma 54-interacting transcriptional regulator [Acidobacteriota bacterium]
MQIPGKSSRIDLLHDISRLLDQSTRLDDTIAPILQLMGEHFQERYGLLKLALALAHRDSAAFEETFGFTEEQKSRGKYKRGEGITGKVLRDGEPIVVPDVSQSEMMLHRAISRKEYKEASYVCVPIKHEASVIGTLAALFQMAEERLLQEHKKFFIIVASLIARAVQLRKLDEERNQLHDQLRERFRPDNIIGNSKAMQRVYDLIAQVSQSDATVLLRGESGVGKELVASAVHYNGPRKKKPFVKVNCAALPENILESELFGHERGAFTGAIRQRVGRFEQADGGTLFLDEIGDFEPGLQVKLLRALQEREFQRVGGDRTITVDVRIIAATNCDLEAMMESGQFRQDLYYRLNVFPVNIPPLRDRKEDINVLADFFVTRYSSKMDKNIRRISTPALNALLTYPWPGNVRELENCIERAILVCEGTTIEEADLPPSIQTARTSGTRLEGSLKAALEAKEKEIISDAIIEARGNMAEAARNLQLTERIMGLRVKKYGLNPKAYRGGPAGHPTKM